jgi:hypothetical protein
MRRIPWLCALLALALASCRSAPAGGSGLPVVSARDDIAQRIDRGDWMVNQRTKVWKVMAASQANRPARHIGYVEQRVYRQRRGGPEFSIYIVTTLDRKEQIGHVDQLGRAFRYEPRRNGDFRQVDLGTNTLQRNVQGIFDTLDRVTLEPTSERRLAFEALDVNHDGLLQPEETRSFGDRIAGADTNHDGVVDFEEFDAVDVL